MVLLLPAFLAQTAPGQETVRDADLPSSTLDSLTRINTASVVFDKNLNTFNWIGRLTLDTVVARTRIGLNAHYLSNIIQSEGAPQGAPRSSESTQQALQLSLAHPLSAPLDIRTQWSSLVYSDNRGIGLSNASNHTLLAGIGYSPGQPSAWCPCRDSGGTGRDPSTTGVRCSISVRRCTTSTSTDTAFWVTPGSTKTGLIRA